MRLMILTPTLSPAPGGISRLTTQLATYLHNWGWEVLVVAPQLSVNVQNSNPSDSAFAFQVDYVPLPFKQAKWRRSHKLIYLLYMMLTVYRWARKWKPDLILATGDYEKWYTAPAARLHGKPWVAIGHGTEIGVRSRSWYLTKWAFEQATAVVCVSRYTWQRMVERGIKPKSGRVILNGGDEALFRRMPAAEIQTLREKLFPHPGRLLITVGRVEDRKAQDVVIRAMPQVLSKVPDTHYLMVGEPKKKKKYDGIARELNVQDHVHFIGLVDPDLLVAYLNIADVFIMTSRHTTTGDFEGYGIAVTEAALCGKPAIGTKESGLAEAIIDQTTGLLVPPEHIDATAEAIIELLSNDAKRAQMSEAAYQHARNERTWKHTAQQYHDLFCEIIR